MEIISRLVVLGLSLSALFVAQSHGLKNQGEALDDLYKAKFSRDSNIDTRAFEVIDAEGTDYVVLDRNSKSQYSREEEGSKEKDRITRLPGQPPAVNFTQYGGYVTVNQSAGRALYYYFVEADHSYPESLPLLLWLNGGPGCSSLAYGAMEELGPFRVHSDGKTLFRNLYSWNKVANVLFLESPAGVGFSYSNTTSDYSTGDAKTAADNYKFLVNWLERYPEYKGRDLYIAGESYAGHYVPQFAHTILRHNKKTKNIVNLKGIMIGNAVINDETDNLGMYEFFGTHALTSNENLRKIQQVCNFAPNVNVSGDCVEATNQADMDVNDIDIYNIYGPLCSNGNLTSKPKKTSLMNTDPCSDYYVYGYLNRAEVQAAMHANMTKLTHDWEPCSDITEWNDSPTTIIPLLQEFMANGLRVWVYSGDTDGRVPVTSTQYSLNKMNLPVKIKWHPWFLKGEVGGYTQTYKGDLTFVTVRGAGHMVPSVQPVRALSLITHFLAGTPLPRPKLIS